MFTILIKNLIIEQFIKKKIKLEKFFWKDIKSSSLKDVVEHIASSNYCKHKIFSPYEIWRKLISQQVTVVEIWLCIFLNLFISSYPDISMIYGDYLIFWKLLFAKHTKKEYKAKCVRKQCSKSKYHYNTEREKQTDQVLLLMVMERGKNRSLLLKNP